MYSQRALDEYATTSVETGSPVELVVKLYEGAMRFLHEAEQAMDRRDLQEKANRIHRAMRIVQELTNALDRSAAPELTERLAALYEYVEYEMLQASTFNDARHLRNASRILQRLHDSWRQLAEQNADVSGPRAPVASTPADVEVPPAPPAAPTPWIDPVEDSASERVPSLSISA